MASSSRRRALLVLLFVFASSFVASAAAAVSRTNSSSFVLAAAQTRRKDPLAGLRYYTGGWNISNKHYLASVGFSASPVFVVAAVWFVSLALAVFIAFCCRCCCCRRSGDNSNGNGGYSYSRAIFAVSLAFLLLFTAAAIIGCIVLYDGQGKFHGSTTATLRYVVNQSDSAVATLREFTGFLETTKAAAAAEKFTLPADLQGKIDGVARRVDASADELAARTASNSRKIRTALETIRKVLIVVAAVMLVVAILGLVFSLCGFKSLVYTLVFFAWILVTATFILSGTFLLLHNATGDTCVAMSEWVQHPQDHTALDDILPCVDAAATSDALRRSKEVNFQLVSLLNNLLSTVANANPPTTSPPSPPAIYNQSGPPVPLLCNPYNPNLTDRPCAGGEIPSADAPEAWRRYVCRATAEGVCVTMGRITPAMYDRMVAAANASAGLVRHGPALADMADCSYVRRAFERVTAAHCPGMRRNSGGVWRALLAVSVAVACAVAAWAAHSRERRRRGEVRRFQVSPYRFPIEEKALLKMSPRRPYRRGDSGGLAAAR